MIFDPLTPRELAALVTALEDAMFDDSDPRDVANAIAPAVRDIANDRVRESEPCLCETGFTCLARHI